MATKTTSATAVIDIARAYADQIVLSGIARVASTLRLTELGNEVAPHGVGLTELRRLLTTNPNRFVYHDRRWLPKARVTAGKGPTSEFIRQTLFTYGVPMPLMEVAGELSSNYGRPKEYYEARIAEMVKNDPNLFVTSNDHVGLAEWLFVARLESDEAARYVNGLRDADVSANSQLDKLDFTDIETAAKNALKTTPLSPKVFSYYAWKNLTSSDPYSPSRYDAVAAFDAVFNSGGFIYGADGLLHPESEAPGWLKKALKDAEKLAPTVEMEESAPLQFGPAEVDEFVGKILASSHSVGVSEMLGEKYELSPADRTWTEDLGTAVNSLKTDDRVSWFGGDRFGKPDLAPEFVHTIPEFFNYSVSEFKDADGEAIDVEMSDDAFSSALRKEMSLPIAQDVLDEDPAPRQKKLPDQLRLVLKSHHREIGTFPLCQIPAGWLPDEPDVQEIVLLRDDGAKLFALVSHETGLIFGLIDWWFEQPIESGAAFSLEKTEYPSVYKFAWLEEADPLVFIDSERMNELRDLAARATDLSGYEILIEVLNKHSKGADFITILAEANVIRRLTRRQVASILSGYHCFYQRSGSPVWHYDQKKVDQGFDRAKRKFVRK
ncbi:MAG: hypothetical protein U0R49_06775 [Fimbriimonadales bacterium]